MANMRVVSADSHMMEPAELWVERDDHKGVDRVLPDAVEGLLGERVPVPHSDVRLGFNPISLVERLCQKAGLCVRIF